MELPVDDAAVEADVPARFERRSSAFVLTTVFFTAAAADAFFETEEDFDFAAGDPVLAPPFRTFSDDAFREALFKSACL